MPVLVALGSLATTLLGGVAALRIGDRRHLVLGLAAGLMLGVVLFDLLPEALGEQPGYLFGVPAVLLASMAGFLALHVIERSAPVHRGHEAEYAGHQHHPGIGILAACVWRARTRAEHLTWASILSTRVLPPPLLADGPVVWLDGAARAQRHLQGRGDLGLAA